MTEIRGKSIRIFLVDGSPQSILTAEIVNWTGHILSCPRAKLAELLQRSEISRTGIYFLTGPDPEGSGQTLVYIGESDKVGNRLTQHNRDTTKDFWEKTFIVTSKDPNLTKAHIRFLESRLLSIAGKSSLVKAVNGNEPIYENLPEADIADMEYFILQMRLILPVLGLEFLKEEPALIKKTKTDLIGEPKAGEQISPTFELNSKKHGLSAIALEVDGEFIVMKGSLCRAAWEGTDGHNYHALYQALRDQNKITLPTLATTAVFQEDVAFASPSAAAAVIYGRASNGRTAWKVQGENTTYAEWQNSLLPETLEDAA